mgnify:CR=1 FL=1
MGGKDHYRIWRNLFHLFHGYSALLFQAGHNVRVVDYLVLDVHRRAKSLQTQVHDVNGPYYTGAESTRGAKYYFQSGTFHGSGFGPTIRQDL